MVGFLSKGDLVVGFLSKGDLVAGFLSKGDLVVGFLSKGDLVVGFLSKGDLVVGFLSKGEKGELAADFFSNGDLGSGDVSVPKAVGAVKRFTRRQKASTCFVTVCLPDVFGSWGWNLRPKEGVSLRTCFGLLFGK